MAARDNRREANRKALQRNPIGKAFPFKPLTGSCRTGHVVAALPSLLSVVPDGSPAKTNPIMVFLRHIGKK
jgi:hypothetical protein